MNQLMEQIFTGKINEGVTIEQGLANLRILYPTDLEYDMKDDDDFKAGRKTRAECNKSVEKINRCRIDHDVKVKKFADGVICDIKEIYDPVITAFETEDIRRKKVAAEEAVKHQKLIDGQLAEIKSIYGFCESARDNKTSKEIQGLIEAVDMIETDEFHKDVIHEAISAKKDTLLDLSQLLSDTIAKENVAKERETLRLETEALKAKEEKAAHQKAIDDKIQNIRNLLSEYFSKTSTEINDKLIGLNNFFPKQEQWGDRCDEVQIAVDLVITQLKELSTSKKMMEDIDAKKLEEEAKVKETQEQQVKDAVITGVGIVVGEGKNIPAKDFYRESDPVDDIPIEVSPENQTNKEWLGDYNQTESPIKSAQEDIRVDIKGFLEWCSNDESVLDDFGYLLISNDPQLEAEALGNIKAKYSVCMNG